MADHRGRVGEKLCHSPSKIARKTRHDHMTYVYNRMCTQLIAGYTPGPFQGVSDIGSLAATVSSVESPPSELFRRKASDVFTKKERSHRLGDDS